MSRNEPSETVVKKLYQMMFDVHQLLNQSNIKYWGDNNTFLGAIRHGGLIPWIDELNIGYHQKDTRKILALKPFLTNCGYSIAKSRFGYKIFKSKSKLVSGKKYSYPFINAMPYKKTDDMYVPAFKTAEKELPNARYTLKEINKLVNISFGEFVIPIPSESDRYLSSNFGDWKKTALIERDGKLVKTRLTRDMKYAAEPQDVKNRSCVNKCLIEGSKIGNPGKYLQKITKSCTAPQGNCMNNFVVKMPVFVVNCEMHKDRYVKFTKHADAAGLSVCRQPCVLGGKFTQGLICEMIKSGLLAGKSSQVNKVEASINMSHYNCWQRIINSCAQYGMIIEDDTEVKPDFIKQVNSILTALQKKGIDFSILHLWNGNWADTAGALKKVLKVGKLEVLRETESYNAGAVCYIISRDYAQYLLKKGLPIRIPQDIMMGNYLSQGNHLTLKMRYRAKDSCYLSPVLDMSCGGVNATGDTTQDPGASTISKINCKKCNF